jgi:hypothetical protein
VDIDKRIAKIQSSIDHNEAMLKEFKNNGKMRETLRVDAVDITKRAIQRFKNTISSLEILKKDLNNDTPTK